MTKTGSTYYEPIPLDFELLAIMPDRGTVGGIHWKGRRAADLKEEVEKRLNDALNGTNEHVDLKPSTVHSRLRSMKVAGYCEHFNATGGRVWARTTKGKQFLARKREILS